MEGFEKTCPKELDGMMNGRTDRKVFAKELNISNLFSSGLRSANISTWKEDGRMRAELATSLR